MKILRAKRWGALACAGLVYCFSCATPVAAAPVVTSVEGPSAGTYPVGRPPAPITVRFDQTVVVTGRPSIGIRVGSATRQAVFWDYANFSALIFDYAPTKEDNGTLSITGPITLNGGTIKSRTDGSDAALSFAPRDFPSVIFDSVPPPAPVITGVTPASPTSSQSFTISGTAEPRARISIQGPPDRDLIWADASGNWASTFPPQMAATYNFTATASDAGLNSSAGTKVTVTVQPTNPQSPAPVITRVTAPADGIYGDSFVQNTHYLGFSVYFSDTVVVSGRPTIRIRIGSTSKEATLNSVFPGQMHFLFTPSGDGPLAITGPISLNGGTIKSRDGMDAVLTFAPVEAPGVLIDTVFPAKPVITGVSPANPTSDQSFTISGTAEPGCRVQTEPRGSAGVLVDANGNWSMTFGPRAPGSHGFRFNVEDKAGNDSNWHRFGDLGVLFTVEVRAASAPAAVTRPVLTGASVTGQVGVSITPVQVSATNNPSSFSAPGLAAYGLSINASGLITGTPTATANAIDVPVTATNSAGASEPANIRLTLSAAAPPPPVTQTPVTTPTPPPPPPPPPPPTSTPPAVVTQPPPPPPPAPASTPLPPPAATPPPPAPTPPTPAATPPPATTTPIVRAAQSIDFVSPVSAIVIGQPVQLGATSSAGLPIVYSIVSGNATISGSALTVTGPGAVVVRATQAGSDTVQPATAEITITGAVRATQSITLSSLLPTELMSDRPLTLAATSSSGLPVRFEVVSGPATLNGDVLRPTAAGGTVVLRAVQGGSDAFEPSNATHTLTIRPATRLINLSSRVRVQAGDSSRAFIVGFVVSGTEPKRILARVVGPGLGAFGVNASLSNPRLRVFNQAGQVVAENDDWTGVDVSAAATRVGAFALSAGSRDAVQLVTLPPGAYTLHVEAVAGEGVALAELYDASDIPALETQQMINLSTRAFVDTGEGVLTAGFVVTGSAPKRVLIRGIGPSLGAFGVTGSLADPSLQLYQGTTVIAQNDDWQTPQLLPATGAPATGAEISAAATAAGAFPLASGTRDAALLVSLPPGAYTVTVSGANNTTGAGLAEVYEVR